MNENTKTPEVAPMQQTPVVSGEPVRSSGTSHGSAPQTPAPGSAPTHGTGGTGNPPPRRRDPWDMPEEPEGPSWTEWFIDANPLYLISVMLMFLGLLLVSREASSHQVTVETVMSFFGIQNLYEVLLVGMAIYLLRSGINPRHGKLLLVFVLVFMADLTFYQVRISAMDAWWGLVISSVYLALGAAKLGAVVYCLGITPRWERLAFPITAFALIYFAPQYVYHAMDAVGKGTGEAATALFSGVWEIYLIWFLAAFIQIPVIIGTWRASDLDQEVANPYLGSERSFYWAILLFPFFVLPFQLVQNVMADAGAGNGAIADMTFNYLPYFLAGIFFLQGFVRKFIEREFSLNAYDFWMLLGALTFAVLTAPGGDVLAPFGFINKAMVILVNVLVTATRQNIYCAGLLTALAAWHFMSLIKSTAAQAAAYGRELSTVAWAAILMAGSFIFLGLGFLVSLKSRPPKSGNGEGLTVS